MVWTESDGTLVAKAKRFETSDNRRIDVSVLIRSLPNLEEKIKELLFEPNLLGNIVATDNQDYINFTIDLNRAHNSNLAFDSLSGRLNGWFEG